MPNKKYSKKLLKFQRICVRIAMFRFGALAQLGERYTGSVEVSGSIPLCSTKKHGKSLMRFAVLLYYKRYFFFTRSKTFPIGFANISRNTTFETA